MNSKNQTQESTEQEPPSVHSLEQVEQQYFRTPEQLGQEQYAANSYQVDNCRINARGGLGRVLNETAFGKFLVKLGLPDQVKLEHQIQTNYRNNYAKKLVDSGICPNQEAAEAYADKYYLALPITPELVTFQIQLQSLVEDSINYPLYIPERSSLSDRLNYAHETLDLRFNFEQIGITKEEAHEMLNRELIWKIKFHFASQMTNGREETLLSLVNTLGQLRHVKERDLTPHLQPELAAFTRFFSENKSARRVLTGFSFNKMAISLKDFHAFSEYLEELSVKKIEGEEFSRHLKSGDLQFALHRADMLDKRNFFDMIAYLKEIGITVKVVEEFPDTKLEITF